MFLKRDAVNLSVLDSLSTHGLFGKRSQIFAPWYTYCLQWCNVNNIHGQYKNRFALMQPVYGKAWFSYVADNGNVHFSNSS